MSMHIFCCCKACYSLTHCDTEAVTYTKTDLSAYVGDVVAIGGECYTVGEPETCPSPADVTVTDDYATCEACETAQDPCPCDSAAACGDCDECTPDEIRVVFSGVTPCDCVPFGSAGYNITFNTALNGSHTLTQVMGENCKWQVNYTNGLHENSWFSDTDCGGSPDEDRDNDYTILLELSGGTWTLTVSADVTYLDSGSIAIFHGTVAQSDSDCFEISPVTNDQDGTAGNDCGDDPVFDPIVALDGTATFTICP